MTGVSEVVRRAARRAARPFAWLTPAVVAALFVVAVVLPAVGSAQTDPRGVYRTFTTPHFRVHFRVADDSVARRAAVIAEDAYQALARELDAPGGMIDMLLTDNVDITNGYAQVLPSKRIVIYLQPPAFSSELRYSVEWLRTIISHELTHVFQMEKADGGFQLGRRIFGRNPLFFPGTLTPSWFKEGLAVYYESRLTGSGRDISGAFPAIARAAAIDSAIPSPDRWSLATSRFPLGQTAYAWGSLLIGESVRSGGEDAARALVRETQIPLLLNWSFRSAIGKSYTSVYEAMRDSMYAAVPRPGYSAMAGGDSAWRVVSGAGFHATAPRWKGNDTLYWTANNGRESTGLYRAVLSDSADSGKRVNRRNSLGVSVPVGEKVVYAQHDYIDAYVYRSDLYEARPGAWRQKRLTRGARLSQPDVREDGTIVASRTGGGSVFLVTVSPDGKRIRRLTATSRSVYTEPRWSPDGRSIAAVELLPDGVERIVLLDSDGVTMSVVAGGNAVFASPSFTPDGKWLVWVSDRSGASQMETVQFELFRNDTVSWKQDTLVRQVTNVRTGLYQPVVSPDGNQVAALLYTNDGMHVVVGPFDSTGVRPVAGWYEERIRERAIADGVWRSETEAAAVRDTLLSTSYNTFRQLLPTYWTLIAGEGRTGSTLGIGSGGYDITNRHAWSAGAMLNSDMDELDAYGNYRFSGFGVPVLSISLSQQWDATLQVVDTSGAFIGDLARRRRFASFSATVPVPRARRYLSASAGVLFEMRKYASDVDAALGPRGSVTRRGTTYQSFFGSLSASTTQSGARAISAEEGFSLVASTAYRWRMDIPEITESWRTIAVGRGFIPLNLPGFSRHVIATRAAVGSTDRRTASEFSIGGVSGGTAELFPGIVAGDGARTFPLRGMEPGVQRGTRAISASVEYRAPLALLTRSPFRLPLFTDKVSINVFADAGRAWCPAGVRILFGADVCDRRAGMDGWLASAGAELAVDLAVPYDVPYRLRLGVGAPFASPPGITQRGSGYLTLGNYF